MSARIEREAARERPYRPDTTTPATVVADPWEHPGPEPEADPEAERMWRELGDLFSTDSWFRVPETVRAALCSGLTDRLPPLTEAPTADEMRRLRKDVLAVDETWMSRCLRQPLGTVRALEEGVITPNPEVVQELPEFRWEDFLGLWSLLYVYERVSAGRS